MMDNFAKHAKKERQILKLKEELKQFGEAPTFRSIKKKNAGFNRPAFPF